MPQVLGREDEETTAAAVDGGLLEALAARELDGAVRPQVLAFLSANGISSLRTLAYLAEDDLSDAFRTFPESVSLGTKGAVRALSAAAKREVEGKLAEGLSDGSDDEAVVLVLGPDEERGVAGARPWEPSEKAYGFEESPAKCRVGPAAASLLLACLLLLLGALALLGELADKARQPTPMPGATANGPGHPPDAHGPPAGGG